MPKPKKLKILSKKKILELKPYLDSLVSKIEVPSYIDSDPIQFMHAFENKNDREIAGFFAAIMAWGRRDIVNAKVEDLLNRMGNNPVVFIQNFTESDAERLEGFKHRTFKALDIYWFAKTFKRILDEFQTFEAFWASCYQISKKDNKELIAVFNERFFSFYPEISSRTRKHISNPDKKSSCKRLYMYLRWCLRKSEVDLGSMNFMPTSELKIPLDVHVARQARRLGLLSRTQNDWKSVQELTEKLKILDSEDPSKYDFALFGLGVYPTFIDENYIINPKSD